MEIWKDVVGYEGFYTISNLGNVKSLDRLVDGRVNNKALRKSKPLKPSKTKRGYMRVVLCHKEGYKKNIPIHRLVAIAFIENKKNHPQVNHINGVKSDNTVGNLEWCDQAYNNRHARATGLNVALMGEKNHSYGLKNKHSLRLKNINTGEIKPIIDVMNEYAHLSRRYVTQMIKGERNNKTNYVLA